MSEQSECTFTDDEVRALLARAASVEASSGARLSLAELRTIAVEAGIPTSALDEALRAHAPIGWGDAVSHWLPRLFRLEAPPPRYQLTAWARGALGRQSWPLLLLIGVLLLPVVWWGPLARSAALAIPVMGALLVAAYGWMLRLNEYSFRSRGMVALTGGIAGFVVGVSALMSGVVLALLGEPRALSFVTAYFAHGAVAGTVLGALCAQLAVEDSFKAKAR